MLLSIYEVKSEMKNKKANEKGIYLLSDCRFNTYYNNEKDTQKHTQLLALPRDTSDLRLHYRKSNGVELRMVVDYK